MRRGTLHKRCLVRCFQLENALDKSESIAFPQVLDGGTGDALEHPLRIDRQVLRQTGWDRRALVLHASTCAFLPI